MIDYSGGPLPYDEMFRERARLRKHNNSKAKSPCTGCPRLEYKDWGIDKKVYNQIAIGPYSACNLTCSYCYMNGFSKEERREKGTALYDVMEPMTQLIRDKKIASEITLVWAGGEPVLYKEFDSIYRILKENNIVAKSYIYSNATIYSEAIYEELKEGRTILNCSVDSGTKDSYYRIKRMDHFEKVKENLRKYITANPSNVIIKYIIIEDNQEKEELDSFISFCSDIKAREIFISKDLFKSDQTEEYKDKVLDTFAYLAYNAVKKNISYFTDVFSRRELFKIKLKIISLIMAESAQVFDPGFQLNGMYNEYYDLFGSDIIQEPAKPAAVKEENKTKGKETPAEENDLYKIALTCIESGKNAIQWRNDYTNAIEQFNDALKLVPEMTEAHFLIGETYRELNDLANAVISFQTAVNIDPFEKKYMEALARTFMLQGKIEEAYQSVIQYLIDNVDDKSITGLVKEIIQSAVNKE